MWNYLLNSIFTHKSCRYAKEGVLNGFATEAALDDPANTDWGYVPQDNDTWPGEKSLV